MGRYRLEHRPVFRIAGGREQFRIGGKAIRRRARGLWAGHYLIAACKVLHQEEPHGTAAAHALKIAFGIHGPIGGLRGPGHLDVAHDVARSPLEGANHENVLAGRLPGGGSCGRAGGRRDGRVRLLRCSCGVCGGFGCGDQGVRDQELLAGVHLDPEQAAGETQVGRQLELGIALVKTLGHAQKKMPVIEHPEITQTVGDDPRSAGLDVAAGKGQHQGLNVLLLALGGVAGIARDEGRGTKGEEDPVFVEEIEADQTLTAKKEVFAGSGKTERRDGNGECWRQAGTLGIPVDNFRRRKRTGWQRREL